MWFVVQAGFQATLYSLKVTKATCSTTCTIFISKLYYDGYYRIISKVNSHAMQSTATLICLRMHSDYKDLSSAIACIKFWFVVSFEAKFNHRHLKFHIPFSSHDQLVIPKLHNSIPFSFSRIMTTYPQSTLNGTNSNRTWNVRSWSFIDFEISLISR